MAFQEKFGHTDRFSVIGTTFGSYSDFLGVNGGNKLMWDPIEKNQQQQVSGFFADMEANCGKKVMPGKTTALLDIKASLHFRPLRVLSSPFGYDKSFNLSLPQYSYRPGQFPPFQAQIIKMPILKIRQLGGFLVLDFWRKLAEPGWLGREAIYLKNDAGFGFDLEGIGIGS